MEKSPQIMDDKLFLTDKHRNVQLAYLPIVLAVAPAPQHSEDSTKSKHSEVGRTFPLENMREVEESFIV